MRTRNCSTLLMLLSAAFVPTTPAAGPQRLTSPPAAFRFIRDAHCTRDRFGGTECRVPGYQPIGASETCPPDAPVFGSISSAAGARLLDRFPEIGARSVATIHDHQFVCIGATASNQVGAPMWSYVVAIPTRFVPDCRHQTLCRNADYPARWVSPAPATPCHLDSAGRYSEGCAAGWVRSDLLDQYTMGIRPIGE